MSSESDSDGFDQTGDRSDNEDCLSTVSYNGDNDFDPYRSGVSLF